MAPLAPTPPVCKQPAVTVVLHSHLLQLLGAGSAWCCRGRAWPEWVSGLPIRWALPGLKGVAPGMSAHAHGVRARQRGAVAQGHAEVQLLAAMGAVVLGDAQLLLIRRHGLVGDGAAARIFHTPVHGAAVGVDVALEFALGPAQQGLDWRLQPAVGISGHAGVGALRRVRVFPHDVAQRLQAARGWGQRVSSWVRSSR